MPEPIRTFVFTFKGSYRTPVVFSMFEETMVVSVSYDTTDDEAYFCALEELKMKLGNRNMITITEYDYDEV